MPTISELQQMETAVLIDMLASHTADYTRMLTEGHNTEEEYARYNLTIKAIQAEIELRKKPLM